MNIETLKQVMTKVKPQFMCLKVSDESGKLEPFNIALGEIEELNSIVFLNFTINFNLEYNDSVYEMGELQVNKFFNIDNEKPFKIKLNFGNGKTKIFPIEDFKFEIEEAYNLITFEHTFPLFRERGIYKRERRVAEIKAKYVECSDEFVIMSIKHTYPEDKNERNFKREIIQLSAEVYDHNFMRIRSFDTFVKPVINPILTERCKELTRINDEMLENAISFKEAYQWFTEFLGEERDEYTYFAFDNNTLKQLKRCVYFDGNGECDFIHYTKNFYAIQEVYCINEDIKLTPSLNDIIRNERFCRITSDMTIIDKVRIILDNSCEKWGFSGN